MLLDDRFEIVRGSEDAPAADASALQAFVVVEETDDSVVRFAELVQKAQSGFASTHEQQTLAWDRSLFGRPLNRCSSVQRATQNPNADKSEVGQQRMDDQDPERYGKRASVEKAIREKDQRRGDDCISDGDGVSR